MYPGTWGTSPILSSVSVRIAKSGLKLSNFDVTTSNFVPRNPLTFHVKTLRIVEAFVACRGLAVANSLCRPARWVPSPEALWEVSTWVPMPGLQVGELVYSLRASDFLVWTLVVVLAAAGVSDQGPPFASSVSGACSGGGVRPGAPSHRFPSSAFSTLQTVVFLLQHVL